jgi:hypothetical protein
LIIESQGRYIKMELEFIKNITNNIDLVSTDNFVEVMETLPNKNYGRLLNELDRVGDSKDYTLWNQQFDSTHNNNNVVTISNDVVEIVFDYNKETTDVFFLNDFQPKWLNWSWILHNLEANYFN